MDIHTALKAFALTVEKGTITDAARALSISQPAVSKHLQNLERRVNARLLERSSRNVRVTTQGVALYESIRYPLKSIEAALETVRLNSGEIEGILRVHAPYSIGFHHLHDLLMNFQQVHPAIDVELVIDDRQVNFVHENYDIAVSYGKITSQDVITRRVGWLRCVLVTIPEFLNSVGGVETPDKLGELDVVSMSDVMPDQNALTLYDRTGDAVEVRVRSSLRTNNSQILINTLLAGRGVGPVQLNLVSRKIADGSLVRILPRYSMKSTEVFLTYPSIRFMRPVVRAFSDFAVPSLKMIEGITSEPE